MLNNIIAIVLVVAMFKFLDMERKYIDNKDKKENKKD